MKNIRMVIIGILLLLGYSFFLHYNLVSDLGYDEARHSVQGLIFRDYLSTLADGNWIRFETFAGEYHKFNYDFAWYAYYDPPIHALTQAVIFLAFGAGTDTARYATLAWIIAGTFFFFLLCRRIFEQNFYALLCTAVFLLLPFTYYYSRQAMVAIPLSLLTSAWMYFTYYSPHKHAMWYGGLFLILSSLMQYQSIVFFATFSLLYSLIIAAQHFKIRHPLIFFRPCLQNPALRTLIVQSSLFVLAFFPWFFISLRTTNVLTHLFKAATIEIKGGVIGTIGYALSFLIQAFTETKGILLLAILPLCYYGKNSFIKKHWVIALYVITTFVIATLLFSNRQFRYIAHVLPFIIIFAFEGLRQLAERASLQKIFPLIIFFIIGTFVVLDISEAQRTTSEWGERQDDVYSYLSSLPQPRIIMGISLRYNTTDHATNFYHSPDLFMFRAMALNPSHNPFLMKQSVMRLELSSWQDAERLMRFLDLSNTTHTQALVLHKRSAQSDTSNTTETIFKKNGFEKTTFSEYVLYEKKASSSELAMSSFPTREQKYRSFAAYVRAQEHLKARRYLNATLELDKSYRNDPLYFDAQKKLIETTPLGAEELLNYNMEHEALILLENALFLEPTNEKIKDLIKNIIYNPTERTETRQVSRS